MRRNTGQRASQNRGFTLMEMLIVVAIIAVLVAVAIPVFSSQLERSREGVDAANIRSAYATVMADATTDDRSSAQWRGTLWRSDNIELKEQQDDWQNEQFAESLGNIATLVGTPQAGGSATVEYDPQTGATTIRFYTKGGNAVGQSLAFKTKTGWRVSNGYLHYGPQDHWNSSAVTDLLDLKAGSTITLGSTSGVAGLDSGATYTIGVFALDPNNENAAGDYKVIWDSKEQGLSASGDTTLTVSGAAAGTGTKVAIQFFKYQGTSGKKANLRDLSDAEMKALTNLISFS